jgi:hypothetical protein
MALISIFNFLVDWQPLYHQETSTPYSTAALLPATMFTLVSTMRNFNKLETKRKPRVTNLFAA